MENWKTMLDDALKENGESWADAEANTMTRDDTIHMAREADIDWHRHWDDEENRLERFAELVAAAEREECAKVCEGLINENTCYVWIPDAREALIYCATAIRARSEK